MTPKSLAGRPETRASPAKIGGILSLLLCCGLGTAFSQLVKAAPAHDDSLTAETMLVEQLLTVRQRLAGLERAGVVPDGQANELQTRDAAVTSPRKTRRAQLRGLLRSLEIRLVLRLRERAAALEVDLAAVRPADRLEDIVALLERFAAELAERDTPETRRLGEGLFDLAGAARELSANGGDRRERGLGPTPPAPSGRQAIHPPSEPLRGGGGSERNVGPTLPIREGAVFGSVTDHDTGQALGGMKVVFEPRGSDTNLTTETTADGFYSIALDVTAVYRADTEDPDHEYLSMGTKELVPWKSSQVQDGHPPFAKRVDFQMRKGGEITGTVRDEETMDAIDEAIVAYRHDRPVEGRRTDAVVGESDGSYRIRPLVEQDHVNLQGSAALTGDYFVENYAGHDKPYDIETGDDVAVTWGAVTSGIDFTLIPAASLEGRVLDALDDPLVAAVCEIWLVVPAALSGPTFTWVAWTETGEDGKCLTGPLEGEDAPLAGEPTPLAPGINYRAVSWDPGRSKSEVYDDQLCSGWSCDLGTGTDLPGIIGTTTTYEVALEEGGCIAGTVTAAAGGAPLEGINVCTYTGDLDTVFIGCSSTATDGTYRHCGHDTGSYYAAADDPSFIYLPGLYDDLPCPAPCIPPPPTGTPIAVTDGATVSGIDFALDRAASISGTVTSAGGAGFVPQVAISAWPPSGPWVASATPAPDGSYLLPGLATGSYWVTTQDVSGGWDGEVWDDHPCNSCDPPATGDAIATTLGSDTGGIDFELDGLGTISGTVREVGTGAGIPGIEVEVYDSSGTLVDSPTTGADGGYMTTDLPVALYTALAVDPGGTYPSELFAQQPCDGCDPTTGAELAVFPGVDNFGVDFTLNPAPGGCADEVTISNTTVDAVVEYEACERLIFGPAFNAEWPALGIALAGESIEIGNGTSIGEGARFTFLTHPDLFP